VVAQVVADYSISHPVWSVVADDHLLDRILLIGVAAHLNSKGVATGFLPINALVSGPPPNPVLQKPPPSSFWKLAFQ
jgi:hypothetical protein